jgi:hypothetical protein
MSPIGRVSPTSTSAIVGDVAGARTVVERHFVPNRERQTAALLILLAHHALGSTAFNHTEIPQPRASEE